MEVFTLELYLILKYELHTYLFNTDLGSIAACSLMYIWLRKLLFYNEKHITLSALDDKV